jgi:hypothetical protein
MSSLGTAVGCGMKTNQDCFVCKWSIHDQQMITIYQANELIDATGVMNVSHSTQGNTEVTIRFLAGSTEVTRYTLINHQCFGFTVLGFNSILLLGNGAVQDFAAGNFSLTPRYK